jgi:hypothetical protein
LRWPKKDQDCINPGGLALSHNSLINDFIKFPALKTKEPRLKILLNQCRQAFRKNQNTMSKLSAWSANERNIGHILFTYSR